MRQDISSYEEKPLHTAGLLQAAHQYSLQDIGGSTCISATLYSLLRSGSSKNLQPSAPEMQVLWTLHVHPLSGIPTSSLFGQNHKKAEDLADLLGGMSLES